jgi:hypothetical protein
VLGMLRSTPKHGMPVVLLIAMPIEYLPKGFVGQVILDEYMPKLSGLSFHQTLLRSR